MWKNREAYLAATQPRHKKKWMSFKDYMHSSEKYRSLKIPTAFNITRRMHAEPIPECMQILFKDIVEQTFKKLCANSSESDSKPRQFLSHLATKKSAKHKSAAVAAGAGENVNTGASRRKKPVRLSPPDESVYTPKRRKLSGRKEEEESAGEESGYEVRQNKKEKKSKKEKKEKKKKKKKTKKRKGCEADPDHEAGDVHLLPRLRRKPRKRQWSRLLMRNLGLPKKKVEPVKAMASCMIGGGGLLQILLHI